MGRKALFGFWLAALGLAAPPARAQPLPEGDTGIAARYPADEGIASDPDVVFTESFEEIATPSLTVDRSGWDNVWGALRITQRPDEAHMGTRAVEITHTGTGSQGAWRDFGPSGWDTLFVRYYMKYHPDFPGCHHTGMALLAAAPGVDIGSSTGVRPDGTNHFTALLDDLPPFVSWTRPGNRPPGMANIYCYHMDQDSEYGDIFFPSGFLYGGIPAGSKFDSSFVPRTDVIVDRGRWYSFELMLESNTPGERNGRVAFWIDGVLIGDFPGLLFRTTGSLRPNTVILSTYASQVHANKTLWYDDVVAATSYIGPMTGGVAPRDAGTPADGGPGTDGGPRPDGAIRGDAAASSDASTGTVGESGCVCRAVPGRGPESAAFVCVGVALVHRARARRRVAARRGSRSRARR